MCIRDKAETLSKIVEAVKRTLERTPPELAADIVDRGIMLAGGGLHLLSGLPRSVTLTSGEIREAMADTLSKIVEAVKRTLERTPPELAADIVDRGIMLAGGGALVRGINDLLSDETGIFTHIAEHPLLCVVNGCGEVLDDFKKLKRVVDTPDFIRNAIRD